MSTNIVCPNCRAEFALDEAMRDHLAVEARKLAAADIGRVRAELDQRAAVAMREKDAELEEARKTATAAVKREGDLLARERALGEKTQAQELEFQKRLTDEAARLQDAARKDADARAEIAIARQIRQKDGEVKAALEAVARATNREAELIQRERALAEAAQAQDLELQRRLAEETSRLQAVARQDAEARAALMTAQKISEKEAELADAKLRLAEAANREADVLRRKQELEARAASQELEILKRVDEHLASVREKARLDGEERLRREREQHQLKEVEHTEARRQLENTVTALQNQIRQGSSQEVGEAQEVRLRDVLADAFRDDRIEDVPKGAAGADLLQRVFTTDRRDCGTIIWESKRTLGWSDVWLQKLRDDKREAGAAIAVIVSQALPAGVSGFGDVEGVWVCSWHHAVPVAAMLRSLLAEVGSARTASANSDAKGRRLYDYLTGQDFRNRFEGVVESYVELRRDLDRERRSLMTAWKKRERQLNRALANLSAVHGDLRGISGTSMEELAAFALEEEQFEALTDGTADEADEPSPAGPDFQLEPAVTDLFLSLLPSDGSTMGNGAHRKRFDEEALSRLSRPVDPAEYAAARGALLAASRIVKGKGRGGSIRRVAPDGSAG